MTEPAEKVRELEETAPAAAAPDAAADASAAADDDADGADDFEDLEFLLDDIEDQIAPLG